jgi:hypothetical protein
MRRIFAIARVGAISEIAQVLLPTGDVAWVRIQALQRAVSADEHDGPVDVGLRDRAASAADALQLSDFAETVRGVVESVRQSFDEHRPDCLAVEFGIEIAARAGGLVSVIADVGGSAHIRVTATWNKTASGSTNRRSELREAT